ncbi:MAG: FKBP-type peptidyl-prolyl cis-trans isomerase [Planctomycetes bacterium]|nr:FKBP-type peptidyl-prolyl cis-trans isomerase [Planctomycetota bacterium]
MKRLLAVLSLSLFAALPAFACKVPDRADVPVTPGPNDVTPTPTVDPRATPIVLTDPTVTPSGLKYVDQVVGTGATPTKTQYVTVNYRGTFATTGQEFDASSRTGGPVSFNMGQVIAGFSEGLSTMKVGGKRIVYVPAALGYGAQERTGIPANSDLIFEIELLAVSDTPPPRPTATATAKPR